MKDKFYFVKMGIGLFAVFALMAFLDAFRNIPREEADQILLWFHWIYGICAAVVVGEYLYKVYFKKQSD